MLTTRNMKERVRGGWRRMVSVLGLTVALTGCTPPGPRALLDGERFLLAGKPAEALRRLRTAVEFLPGNCQAWNHLGIALHATRQPGEAADAYQHALQLDRNLAAAHFNLGCLFQEQGDFARAADSFRTFVGLQPRATEGWVRLGQAQLRNRQWEPAERSFQGALRQLPGDPEALNGLGVALQQRRRVNEAWGCFTNVVTRHPTFAPAWLNLGVAAHQSGLKSFAAQAYRHYANLRPESGRALGIIGVAEQLEALTRPVYLLPPVQPTNALSVVRSTNGVMAAPAPPSNRTNPVAPAVATMATNTAPPAISASGGETGSAALSNGLASTVTPAVSRPTAPPPASGSNVTVSAISTNGQTRPPPAPAVAIAEAIAAVKSVIETDRPAQPGDAVSTNPTAASLVPAPAPPPASITRTSAPPSGVAGNVPPPVESPEIATHPEPSTVASVPPVVTVAELVRIPAQLRIPTEVRDEPPPRIPPGPGTTNNLAGAGDTGSAVRPSSRPVGADRNPPAGAGIEGRGFWRRANPVRWFGDEPGKAEAPVGTANAMEEDGAGGWRWANPTRWFKGEKGPEPVRGPTPVGTGFAPATNRPVAVAAVVPSASEGGSGRVPDTSNRNPVRRPAGNAGDRPMVSSTVVTEPIKEVRRYRYINPAVPRTGDAAAALEQVSLGVQEHRRDRLDSAIRFYDTARDLDPSSFEALHNLALARLQRGDVSESLKACEEALAVQPESSAARFTLALALDRAGYPVDSAAEAERVVRRRADDAAGHLLLANLYAQRLGDPSRARSHYLRVIELQPDHPQSNAIRNWLADHR